MDVSGSRYTSIHLSFRGPFAKQVCFRHLSRPWFLQGFYFRQSNPDQPLYQVFSWRFWSLLICFQWFFWRYSWIEGKSHHPILAGVNWTTMLFQHVLTWERHLSFFPERRFAGCHLPGFLRRYCITPANPDSINQHLPVMAFAFFRGSKSTWHPQSLVAVEWQIPLHVFSRRVYHCYSNF